LQCGGFVRSGAFANAFGEFGNPGVFGDMAQAVNQFFLNGGTTAYVILLKNSILQGLAPSVVSLGPAPGGGATGSVLSVLPSGASTPANAVTFTATEVTDELLTMSITIRPIPLTPTSPPGDQLADIIIMYGPASLASSPPVSPPSSPAPAPGPGTVVETYRRVSLSPKANGTANPNNITTRLAASALVTVAVGSGKPQQSR
jgi:hypothetical protein